MAGLPGVGRGSDGLDVDDDDDEDTNYNNYGSYNNGNNGDDSNTDDTDDIDDNTDILCLFCIDPVLNDGNSDRSSGWYVHPSFAGLRSRYAGEFRQGQTGSSEAAYGLVCFANVGMKA